jgi:hypothetical protein
MNNYRTRKVLLAAAVMVALGGARSASADEGHTPFLPGFTTGLPIAAAPPPGWYLNATLGSLTGTLQSGVGTGLPVTVQNANQIGLLIYVPDFKLFGAQYYVAATDPHIFKNVDAFGAAYQSNAFFNAIISPVNLSWKLNNGWFVGAGLSVYLPTGYYQDQPCGAGRCETLPSFANNFYTFEPNLAVSYLGNNWNITLNTVFDFNTLNTATNYQSGSAVYFDATVAKKFGNWSLGVIGNYSRQFTNDTQNGIVVPSTGGVGAPGNKFEHLMGGLYTAYDFGPTRLSVRYLNDFETQNDIKLRMFLVTLFTPLSTPEPSPVKTLITK